MALTDVGAFISGALPIFVAENKMHRRPFWFGGKIDGDPWFTWWFNHLPGPSICPKRTPMTTCGSLVLADAVGGGGGGRGRFWPTPIKTTCGRLFWPQSART